MATSFKTIRALCVVSVFLGAVSASLAARPIDFEPASIGGLRAAVTQHGRVRALVEFRQDDQTIRRAAVNTDLVDDDHLVRLERFDNPAIALFDVDLDGLDRLAADSRVVGIWEDVLMRSSLDHSAAQIGAPEAWAAGYEGRGVQIAILDTGVERSHPFFRGRVVGEACFSSEWKPFRLRSACPNNKTQMTGRGSAAPCRGDGCEHGTHVAGIAAGHSSFLSGVAPGAEIVAVQVFSLINDPQVCGGNAYTPCPAAFTSDVLRGLEFVERRRLAGEPIVAVNLSLGVTSMWLCDTGGPLLGVMQRLVNAGVLPVAAVSNYDSACGSYPACLPQVVAVGRADLYYPLECIDMLAPGYKILSSISPVGYTRFTGTSMAAPHISGSIAVIRSAHPEFDALDSFDALRSGRTDALMPSLGVSVMPDRFHAGNLDFELGRNQGWEERGGYHPLVDGPLLTPSLPVTPNSGSWMAHLGDAPYDRTKLSQPVYFPAGGEWEMRYSRQVRSSESSGCPSWFDSSVRWTDSQDYSRDDQLESERVCSDKSSLDWQQRSVLFHNPSGRLGVLSISTWSSSTPPSVFLDDISFVQVTAPEATTPPDPPAPDTPVRPAKSATFSITGGTVSSGEIGFEVEWGDGTRSLTGEAPGYDVRAASHVWLRSGTYSVRSRVRTPKNVTSTWSIPVVISVAEPIDTGDLSGRWLGRKSSCGTVCSVSGDLEITRSDSLSTGASVDLRIYLAKSVVPGAPRILLYQLPELQWDSTGRKTVNFWAQLPPGTISGTYLIAVIDEVNAIAESNESNNEVAIRLKR